ncbi:MAG: AbrB/MazE/SpoVT family DNA-binding domain-containing protein, partial [Anaerolineales bacterium]
RKEISMEAYITVKGQIVIPAELRRKYGITPNTRIAIVDNGNEIILRPINEEYLKKLQGSLKGSGALEALIEERRKDREREDAKLRRS